MSLWPISFNYFHSLLEILPGIHNNKRRFKNKIIPDYKQIEHKVRSVPFIAGPLTKLRILQEKSIQGKWKRGSNRVVRRAPRHEYCGKIHNPIKEGQ